LPEHQRVKQVVKLETNAPTSLMGGTTWYLHGSNNSLLYEKEVKANGVTEHRHYLQAAGMTVALAVVRRSGTGVSTTQLTYYQQDHLGSIAVVTDANGAVLERMAYDPWGKRRFTTGLADKNDSIVGVNTDRGYTEHEHLDEMGVIHMNGRLYDPLVGRFMSADPYIQSPENLQSYNRFAYVMNNPLAYTHPSGYWSWKKFRQAVIMIGVAVTLGPAASGYLYTTWGVTAATASIGQVIVVGAISGAVAGYAGGYLSVIATGGTAAEARAAGKSGAISGMLFGAAGGVGDANSWSRLAAHATAGCVSSVSGGGKCGEGAASAVFGKWTTNAIGAPGMNDSPAELVAKGVATMVAGGVGSVIAGGKFESGAETAAYGYLFNAVRTRGWDAWDRGFAPKDTSNCGSPECKAGLLPAHSENRTNEQIDRDLNRFSCELSTSIATSFVSAPAATMKYMVNKLGQYVAYAVDYLIGEVVTTTTQSIVCR
jgi:RHS repeat-associated protein